MQREKHKILNALEKKDWKIANVIKTKQQRRNDFDK